MPTLDEVQRLSDECFHSLCDELIRRLEPRYARLRTHGLNKVGKSIVGQPDSYVGDSAETCRIAFCYTVQKKDWWAKLVEDVEKAARTSPNVEEIVAALPWNVDRDGPTKGENLDWLDKAKAAAGKARLSIVDGPRIAGLLDSDHQDLRHAHLRIPYSRLSYQAILAACRHATAAALADLRAQGRYDSAHYLYRDADRELFRLWQRAASGAKTVADRDEAVRLIALVNDSGFGKTSLLCSFAASLSACQPVLFLQARHLSFASEDALVRSVVQALQGVLAPDLARGEEAEVVHHLRQARLTVVLDGLDEAGNAEAVRRAVRYWPDSRLGRRSVLVLSSRREFWRLASERSWGRWMAEMRADDRVAATPGDRAALARSDPSAGVRLPGLFSPAELEGAWVAGGRLPADLSALPDEVREELRHPFTLRAFLDLSAGDRPIVARSRTDIMSDWLDVRLRAEEDEAARITSGTYRVALVEVARRLATGNAGWVAVDQLGGVPRFDASRPPGPVVERLLHAGILETLPGHADRIRFVFEAVQDFYLAEHDVAAAVGDSQAVALALADGSFSKVYIRLDRLGRGLAGSPARNEFLDALADLDPVRAAVVMRANPGAYESAVRAKVVAGLIREGLSSRHRVRVAFTANLLGHLDCQEARKALIECLPVEECPFHLRIMGARAFTRLGSVERVGFVYEYPWFGLGDDPYYFNEDIQRFRAASPAFKAALGDYAAVRLAALSGTAEHVRSVTVLAHLGDARLVEHLNNRLAANGALQGYENHALIAVGTEPAAAVFTSSLRDAAAALSQLGHEGGRDSRIRVHYSVSPKSADLRYLITPPFEAALESLISDADEEVAGLAADLADTSKSPRLLHRSLVVRAERRGHHFLSTDRVADTVDPPTWVSWWNAAESDAIRSMLLRVMSPVPSAETERILIECLDNPKFRSAAAGHLGRMGSHQAAAPLRQLLEEGLRGREALEVIRAISRLADPTAVGVLARMAKDAVGDQLSIISTALGAIGTEESEGVLVRLLDTGNEPDWPASGLFLHGSRSAVARLVAEARKDGRDPLWLAMRMRRSFTWWGWKAGRFHTHVQDGELIAYLEEREQEFKGPAKWDLLHAVEQIDSENVRRLLRKVADRRGTPEDDMVRVDDLRASSLAFRDLMNREDPAAVDHFVTEAISLDEQRRWAARDLVRLPRDVVANHLREALTAADTDERRAVVVRLMGHFGSEGDVAAVRGLVESGDDELADAAYEALCRLTDPLLVPAGWDRP